MNAAKYNMGVKKTAEMAKALTVSHNPPQKKPSRHEFGTADEAVERKDEVITLSSLCV